jgi:hypothetical protein
MTIKFLFLPELQIIIIAIQRKKKLQFFVSVFNPEMNVLDMAQFSLNILGGLNLQFVLMRIHTFQQKNKLVFFHTIGNK